MQKLIGLARGGKLLKNIIDKKEGKITEKAFMQGLVISVVGILLCVVALCSATYAWFANETSSNSNILAAGTFAFTVSVDKVEDGEEAESEVVIKSDLGREGIYYCTLEEGTYTVSLKLVGESTVKGHCIVTLGDNEPKRTAAIIGEGTVNVSEQQITDPFIFTITVSETTVVEFEPRWGIVAAPDIEYNGSYSIGSTTESEAATEYESTTESEAVTEYETVSESESVTE